MDHPRRDGAEEVGRDAMTVVPVAPGGGGDRVVRWVVAAVVLLVVAVVKPWDDAGGVAPSPATGPTAPAAATEASPSADASRSPAVVTDEIDPDVMLACLEPASWRVASIEDYDRRTIRIWRALEPGTAAGPLDPAIPFVLLVSERLSELGWCAPAAGSERPTGETVVQAWTVTGYRATPLRLVRTDRTPRRSSFGAMYAPSSAVPGRQVTPLTGWPAGRYVFRLLIAEGDERWFGVDLELRPAVTRERRDADPSASARLP